MFELIQIAVCIVVGGYLAMLATIFGFWVVITIFYMFGLVSKEDYNKLYK